MSSFGRCRFRMVLLYLQFWEKKLNIFFSKTIRILIVMHNNQNYCPTQSLMKVVYYRSFTNNVTNHLEIVWEFSSLKFLRCIPQNAEVCRYSRWSNDVSSRDEKSTKFSLICCINLLVFFFLLAGDGYSWQQWLRGHLYKLWLQSVFPVLLASINLDSRMISLLVSNTVMFGVQQPKVETLTLEMFSTVRSVSQS